MKLKQIIILAALSAVSAVWAQPNPYKQYTDNLPFAMPEVKAPVFPANEVVLTDFGAQGDGSSLCTDAFARAIDALGKKGGGRLVVPQGVWFTGPIVLKSNINLHLEKGAVILFSNDDSLYSLIETSFEGLETRRCQSPLSANGAVNIAVTGQGAIDGNGLAWRPLKKQKVTEAQWKAFTSQPGGVFKRDDLWLPSAGYLHADTTANMNVPTGMKSEADWNYIKRFLRPVMVSLVGCKNVLLKDVIFQNSPAWNIHPLMCENIIIDNVLARNPAYAQNGDALDLESCRNALIVNSVFDAGDDGICIKSGKDADGRKRGRPCENVVVDGCTVFQGHGGFVVGSEMSGGVKNILVQKCQFLGTDVGLRFKSCRGRGGVVQNIFIRDISMFDIQGDAITFDLYYGSKSVIEVLESGEKVNNIEAKPVDETTPEFRDITIERIACRNARRALFFNGLPEMPIRNISLKDIHVTARVPNDFFNCKNVTQDKVEVELRIKN